MEEIDLMRRISELYVKVNDAMSKYALYSGLIDSDTLEFTKSEKINRDDLCPREAMKHLMDAYKEAIALREVCRIYSELEDKTPKLAEGVSRSMKIAEIVINDGEVFINLKVKDLPEEITYHRRKKSLLDKILCSRRQQI